MCFSPQASFTAAAALAVLSAITYKKASHSRLRFLALSPLFFGVQQMLEGFVWVTLLNNDTTSLLHHYSVLGFLFFASVFWPFWIPEMLYLVESNIHRRILLAFCCGFGTVFGIISAIQLINYGGTAHIATRHIAYDVAWEQQSLINLPQGWLIPVGTAVYLLATVLPFFISSINYIWIIGVIISLGFIVSHVFYAMAFGSVWCFFAAIASMLLYLIIQHDKSSKNL
jgi:hypothetical protein